MIISTYEISEDCMNYDVCSLPLLSDNAVASSQVTLSIMESTLVVPPMYSLLCTVVRAIMFEALQK